MLARAAICAIMLLSNLFFGKLLDLQTFHNGAISYYTCLKLANCLKGA